MFRKSLFSLVLLLACAALPAQTLSRYEYWLDSDYGDRTAVNSSQTDISTVLDLENYERGIHFFNFRAVNDQGGYGSVNRYLVYIPSASATSKEIVSYEYWLDSDYGDRTAVNSSQTDINTVLSLDTLSTGIHFFNFRAVNDQGGYGSVNRYLVYIPSASATSQEIVSYEYWMDNDYAHRTATESSQTEISTALSLDTLSTGIHFFNFRAVNDQGGYGSVNRYLVYIPSASATSKEIVSYEYWMDNDYAHRTVTESSQTEISTMLSLDTLSTGIHFFNFRAVNDQGGYGSVNRYLVYIPSASATSQEIVSYEYWMDNDYAHRMNVESSQTELAFSLQLDTLSQGVHFFNFRAVNDQGGYGSVNRYLVYLPDAVSSGNAVLTGYQYNFNNYQRFVELDNVKSYEMNSVQFPVPDVLDMVSVSSETPFVFDTETDSVSVSRTTDIVFALQFKNSHGQWSSPEFSTFQASDSIGHKAVNLEIQKTVTFDKFPVGDFRVCRIDISNSQTYYLRSSQECAMLIYSSKGKLVAQIKSENLYKTYSMGLSKGTYYGILYNVKTDADNSDDYFSVKLMLTNNTVPAPEIKYENEQVTMSCAEEGATIYYTLDGSAPSSTSTQYTAPFILNHNATVKAIAYKDGMGESYVTKLVVDTYKVEKPVIEISDLKIYMSTATKGASILYTLDGSDPASGGTVYSNPIPISSNCTVKAIGRKDGYHDSDQAEQMIDVSNITCAAPTFTLVSDKLTISTRSSNATIYYTVDGTEPTRQSNVYTEPITLTRNCTVKAFATKTGEVDSKVSTYVADWFQAATPSFSFADNMLTISCTTPGAVIYYDFNKKPVTGSYKYEKPVVLTENKSVYAMAVADGFNDSEVAVYNPTQFSCEMPAIVYDGRSIELSTETDGASVYYTVDGTYPTEESALYTGKIMLEGLCTVKAIAIKEYMNNSDVLSYELPSYYNDDVLYTSKEGQASAAFVWCNGTPTGTSLSVTGPADASDLAYIRAMTTLKHLDMTGAQIKDKTLPDSAFAGMNIVTVKFPKKVDKAGAAILAGCGKLAAIEWNPELDVPEDIVAGKELPNLLLYVSSKSFAPSAIRNVIVNDRAESILLQDSEVSDFYCPRSFTAQSISYTHSFEQKTNEGVCQGWESIALPFDVEEIRHEQNGLSAPFAAMDDAKMPFWLYELRSAGFEKASSIKANTPYIISMPNEDIYSDCYILAGNVTFSAQDATVQASSDIVTGTNGTFRLVPSFENRASGGSYEINVGQAYKNYAEGSVFAKDLRSIRPFEAYAESLSSNQNVFRIFESTTFIETLQPSQGGVQVYVDGKLVYVVSDQDRTIALYSISGRLIRILNVKKGENLVEGLSPAVYTIQGVKFVVK